MKKREVLLFALAAVLATACSSDVVEPAGKAVTRGSDGSDGSQMPVNFNAYTNRGVTRGGAVGTMENTALKSAATDIGQAGFGVFAYYTNSDDYDSHVQPNFMFNQQVRWNATYGLFDYEPVRYWPNEYGQSAQSEDIDKVSFFAYAPYVAVVPKTGYLADAGTDHEAATWGITGTSRNTYAGDPLVMYITSFDMAKGVDLCWGVYNEDGGWATMNGRQTVNQGLPWLNVQHAESINQRLRFTFYHATSKVNVQIDANIDGSSDYSLGTHYGTGSADPDGTTKIYVRSVSFTGIATEGALNLNNVRAAKPLWMAYGGTGWIENGQTVTVHDGLRDGWEGYGDATAINETLTGLNPVVISNNGNTSAGVTTSAVNLFGRSDGSSGLTDGVYVIPTGEPVKVTVTYDVETAVDNLPGKLSDGVTNGTSIENRITQTLMLNGSPLTFEGGKSYTLKLHLGLNSVKFSAQVSSWEDGESAGSETWVPGGSDTPNPMTLFGINKTTLSLTPTDQETVLAVNIPAGETVNWTTSDASIASLSAPAGTRGDSHTGSSVRITAGQIGTATVTASTSASGAIAVCTVTVSAANATLISPPTANTLDYTGSPQALVEAGLCSGGTMQYGIGTSTAAPASYYESIPTGTDAGDYWVWYYAKGSDGRGDSSADKIKVTINKVPATLTCGTAALSFTKTDNVNATAAKTGVSCTGGTIVVSSADQTKCTASYSGGTITVTRKTVEAFSDVKITVSVTPDANHTAPASVEFSVSAAEYEQGVDVRTNGVDNWSDEENITVNGNTDTL